MDRDRAVPIPPRERLPTLNVSKPIKKEEDHDLLGEARQYLPLYTMEIVQHGGPGTLYVVELQVVRLLGMRIETLRTRYPHLRRVPVSAKEKERLWPSLGPMVRASEPIDDNKSPTSMDECDAKQWFLGSEVCFIPLEQAKSMIEDDFGYLSDRLTLSAIEVPPMKYGLPPKFAFKMQKCGRLQSSHRSSF